MLMHNLFLMMLFSPLLGGMFAGLFRHQLGRFGVYTITIAGISFAFISSLFLLKILFWDGAATETYRLYTWGVIQGIDLHMGFLIDSLTIFMASIVTSISLLVHIYSIGYMHDDPGYGRFFSYMSLFTFAMLLLLGADNVLQLFFGWEGVGVVSYLLIGFWFHKNSAARGSLKAFLVNRVGDFGFLLGILWLLSLTGTVNYQEIFQLASGLADKTISLGSLGSVNVLTCIDLLLFVGAMGKSAQMPLHVWLPESMEGPTPISALIHAATMVTAGVYMVVRMSPLFELSQAALSFILIVGSTGAFFLGLVGIVQQDIKRVIAYSTLSQLGYMVAATGASFAAAGLFHLLTHAFFKALLFLGAGSVIVALHHEQDLRKMGGLKNYLPVTYWTFLIGSLSLSALPPFSGFYSKDAIIEVVHHTQIFGSHYAYYCLLMGAFVTAFYSFRVFFLAFHGESRLAHPESIKESFLSISLPLIILAVPSTFIGLLMVKPMLYTLPGLLNKSFYIAPQHQMILQRFVEDYPGNFHAILHAFKGLPFWFSMAGLGLAWINYCRYPHLPAMFAKSMSLFYRILVNKYGFDIFNDYFFGQFVPRLGRFFYQIVDRRLIDYHGVLGIGRFIKCFGNQVKKLQTGYLYHAVFSIIIGLFLCCILLIKDF